MFNNRSFNFLHCQLWQLEFVASCCILQKVRKRKGRSLEVYLRRLPSSASRYYFLAGGAHLRLAASESSSRRMPAGQRSGESITIPIPRALRHSFRVLSATVAAADAANSCRDARVRFTMSATRTNGSLDN